MEPSAKLNLTFLPVGAKTAGNSDIQQNTVDSPHIASVPLVIPV